MGLENIHTPEPKNTEVLASGFKKLTQEELDSSVFQKLEQELDDSGFEPANSIAVSEILHDNSLFCRSENFSKVIDLVTEFSPIELIGDNGDANMCNMSSTEGYKTAMNEGFSGEDVGHAVKVVVSFTGENLTSHKSIPLDSDLWKFKPETAAVSASGNGKISHNDVKMLSFRFPIHLFPEYMLSIKEEERHEENEIQFIVRHYIPKKTAH